jgi:hypothetical protein
MGEERTEKKEEASADSRNDIFLTIEEEKRHY